jgi:hypothetical protein
MSNKELYNKILQASNHIHKSSTKGSANYMITSPEAVSMLQGIYNAQKAKYRKEKIKRLFNDEGREI